MRGSTADAGREISASSDVEADDHQIAASVASGIFWVHAPELWPIVRIEIETIGSQEHRPDRPPDSARPDRRARPVLGNHPLTRLTAHPEPVSGASATHAGWADLGPCHSRAVCVRLGAGPGRPMAVVA